MILFVGQMASDQKDSKVFQEVDYGQMLGLIPKLVAQIDCSDRIVEYVSWVFYIALSGCLGTVVLALPEDMLSSEVVVDDVPKAQLVPLPPVDMATIEIAACLQPLKKPLGEIASSGYRLFSLQSRRNG